MRVTLGPVTFDDGNPHEPGPAAFPNGPTVYVFNDWGQARSIMQEQMTMTGPFSPDGKSMIYTVRSDPEAFIGLEPGAIVNYATDPWPPALREVLIWRAARARIEIEHRR